MQALEMADDALQVPVDVGLVVALKARLRDPSLCVLARDRVRKGHALLDRSRDDGEQPGAPLVDEGHAVQLVFVEHFEQRRHVNRFVEGDVIVHTNRQRERSHQPARPAGEQGQRLALQSLRLEPRTNRRCFPHEVGTQPIVEVFACFLHEIVERRDVRSPDVAGRVEVQEYAQDAGAAGITPLELFDVSHGEHEVERGDRS